MKRLVGLVLALLLAGCQAVRDQTPVHAEPQGPSGDLGREKSVVPNITVQAEPASGMKAGVGGTFRLAYRNRTAAPLVLTFVGNQVELVIWSDSGQEVWSYTRDVGFGQAETTVTIAPSQVHIFEVPWSGKDQQGKPVRPGSYRAVMALQADGYARASGAIDFQVR